MTTFVFRGYYANISATSTSEAITPDVELVITVEDNAQISYSEGRLSSEFGLFPVIDFSNVVITLDGIDLQTEYNGDISVFEETWGTNGENRTGVLGFTPHGTSDIDFYEFFVYGDDRPIPTNFEEFIEIRDYRLDVNNGLTHAPEFDTEVSLSEWNYFSVTQNDNYTGSSGNDSFNSGRGRDSLFGHEGDDILRGAAGSDRLAGGRGSDELYGNNGRDRISGNQGNDSLYGGRHSDTISGGSGHDEIRGGSGADQIRGGRGRDTLNGGNGNDTLIGGSHKDQIIGGRGNDELHGNQGADLFVFHDGFGRDTIADFDTGRSLERIDLRSVTEITSFDDLMANHTDSRNGNAVISDGDGNSITLEGVDLADLSAGDFLF